MVDPRLTIKYVAIDQLHPAEYNPRRWDDQAVASLKASIEKHGTVDPLICNSAPGRESVVIAGHFRLHVLKQLGYTEVPVVYLNIPNLADEKDLNLRLNRSVGDWDWSLLAQFDESVLGDVGFTSEDLDQIFPPEDNPEIFDLEKELEKLGISGVTMQKGEIYALGSSKLMIGDSTVEEDVLKLMGGEKADMCFTDEPYLLNYLQGKKKHGQATTGFGYKRDRRYLETESLPPNFIELWTANINKVQKENFSIIAFENWKNLRALWGALEKYWKIKNLIIWHLKNRHQGYSSKHQFFNKHDIALAAASPEANIEFNLEEEEDGLQQEFETSLVAISGDPSWEGYQRGKKIQPTDFIEYTADDEKSSGQGIIFGTKPVEILLPYIKVLTRRDDLIIEPFCGSGSTLIAACKLKRRCYAMEKSPTYAEVIRARWEKYSGQKAVKIDG